jgi:putative ATPase
MSASQGDLFSKQDLALLQGTPLPEKLRPKTLDGVLGQPVAINTLNSYLEQGRLPNLILWGPPGTGKTTAAQALAQGFSFHYEAINAIETGSKQLKELGDQARERRLQFHQQTLLFIDEIHRLNKAQQDVLLPFIEKGHLILVGATTENPSYELNKAILSRSRIIPFERVTASVLSQLLRKAVLENHWDLEKVISPEVETHLVNWAEGDVRKFLLAVEEIFHSGQKFLTLDHLQTFLGPRWIGYDKSSDEHYDSISAFIKSVRGSDPDAALYYLARMLKGGEDPLFIARRLVILASEDIGNADPRALQVAVSGFQALEMIGLPEGAINLAQVVTYLASAPKSNRSYKAWKKAEQFIESSGTAPIPKSLRSAKTTEMQQQGYGKGYSYPHEDSRSYIEQNYWPEGLQPQSFYEPKNIGFEKQIREFQQWLKGK